MSRRFSEFAVAASETNVAAKQQCCNVARLHAAQRVMRGCCCAGLVGLSIEKVVNGSNPDPKLNWRGVYGFQDLRC